MTYDPTNPRSKATPRPYQRFSEGCAKVVVGTITAGIVVLAAIGTASAAVWLIRFAVS